MDTGDWPPLSKEKYLAQCLQFLEPQAGATIKRSVNFGGGQFSSGEWKYAGGVVEIVKKCSEVFATTTLPTSTLNNKICCLQVSVLWNRACNGEELWRLYLRRHALRNTFIGFGGLHGLYGNHIVYGCSGVESRVRLGKWHCVDSLKFPPTRGKCSSKTIPEPKVPL